MIPLCMMAGVMIFGIRVSRQNQQVVKKIQDDIDQQMEFAHYLAHMREDMAIDAYSQPQFEHQWNQSQIKKLLEVEFKERQ